MVLRVAAGGPGDVFTQIEEVAQLVLREIHRELLLALPVKTTVQQMAVGVTLLRHGGRLTMSEVAHIFGVSLSAVTASARRLARAGFIRRYRDSSDRRLVWLELTPAGREAVATFLEIRDRVLERFFGALSPADLAAMRAILEKLRSRGS